MGKYIVKQCPALALSMNYYCSEHTKRCQNVTDCVIKKVIDNLNQVLYACHCDNCDGCGYENGCGDTECGTYQAFKSLEILDLEGST